MAAKKTLPNDASMGLVTSRDPSTLKPGELTEAIGCEYRVGSPHLYKQLGRVDMGASLGAPVLSINKLQFDEGDDAIIADANGIIYESAVATDLSFSSSGVEGLSTTAVPQYTGARDRWFRCNGVDTNYIREGDDVPGGSEGKWRQVGMEVALAPINYTIEKIDAGGHTLRPSTYTNEVFGQFLWNGSGGNLDLGIGLPPDGTWMSGYHRPNDAIDGYTGVGEGTISVTSGSADVTGVGTNFARQLTVGTVIIFPDGISVTVLSITNATTLALTATVSTTETAQTFIYTNSNSSYLAESTNSDGDTGTNRHHNRNRTQRACRCVWKFTSDLAYPTRTLVISHFSVANPEWQGPEFKIREMIVHLEYSVNSGVTYQDIGVWYQNFPDVDTTFPIPDDIDTSALWIRSTVSIRPGTTDHDVHHGIRDIKLTTGSGVAYTAENPLFYGIVESYTDSDNIEHLSNMGTTIEISPSAIQLATSITLILPEVVNPLATKIYIYRSIDATTGGKQAMYRIGTANVGDISWIDYFNPDPTNSDEITTKHLYPLINLLYSTGESSTTSFYTKPPLSFMTLPFQGSLVYLPSEVDKARRMYYSLPATVSSNALEQVPEQYYLDFQTPRNDTIKSAAITNGGRSMLAFFENYTMLVNYLPMGSDPGGFNNTVKEFVSDVRGSLGRDTCVEFTLPVGQTLVAAIDGLGLWITNGVNMVDEWSEDLEWDETFDGVDLSTARLMDNPSKRRLELLYTNADGNQAEYHFFYGRMKPGVRNPVPLITGPHPSGIMSKFYTVIDSKWEGYSGSISEDGLVFHENDGTVDDAEGYDATGIIPFSFTGGDIYPEGLTRANILEQINMKFSDGVDKTYNVNITMIRDKGTDATVEKTFSAGSQQQIYVHKQLDRVRVQVQDLTATEASAFVGMAYEFRDSGISRDK